MLKIFIDWIYVKINLDKKERKGIYIKEGEVRWCALGENVGDEENGKGYIFRRPVLVFKKFNNNIFWGIPMSTKNKDNIYYVKVLLKNTEQSVIISQLRVLDTKRLDTHIGYLSDKDFAMIQRSIKDLIKIKSNLKPERF
ncbi:MAG: type II toxin-antitoxin system PemK/MazF family toxin [bacterium]